MPNACRRITLAVMIALLATLPLGAQSIAPPSSPPDSGLYTTYSFNSGFQTVYWVVCGATQDSEGCYDSGSVGPFGRAGSLIEGNQSVNYTTSTVTRFIYIVDVASGSGGTGVTLYVYKKVDVVTSSFDTTTVTLDKTVSLPLTGGSTAVASMAANAGYLFIGTDVSTFAVKVQKSNLAVTQVGGFSPPENVTAITSDKYGYVTVTFGGATNGGFYAYGPNGELVEDGGGSDFMLSTDAGLSTANLNPVGGANVDGANPAGVNQERLVIRPRHASEPGEPHQ